VLTDLRCVAAARRVCVGHHAHRHCGLKIRGLWANTACTITGLGNEIATAVITGTSPAHGLTDLDPFTTGCGRVCVVTTLTGTVKLLRRTPQTRLVHHKGSMTSRYSFGQRLCARITAIKTGNSAWQLFNVSPHRFNGSAAAVAQALRPWTTPDNVQCKP